MQKTIEEIAEYYDGLNKVIYKRNRDMYRTSLVELEPDEIETKEYSYDGINLNDVRHLSLGVDKEKSIIFIELHKQCSEYVIAKEWKIDKNKMLQALFDLGLKFRNLNIRMV